MTSAALLFIFQTPLNFEVATIKQPPPLEAGQSASGPIACHARDAGSVQIPLGRCVVGRRPLADVIAWAYGVQRVLISGGPEWIGTMRFDIEGKSEDTAGSNYNQLRTMFQNLMADRFKLKFHRETRQVDGYVMVLAKGGSRLKESAPGGPNIASQTNSSVVYTNSTVARLVQFLGSFILGRPVIDQTGLTGLYDFNLKWTPGEWQAGYVANPDALTGPSIFTALQEQLGLKLESRKVPTEGFVIDSAELPKPDGR